MESQSSSNLEILQYVPFKSFVHPSFWYKLSEIKIDVDKLDDSPKTIYGYFTNYKAKNCLLEVDYSALNNDFVPPKYNFTAYGILYNKNTIEEFKNCDKTNLLEIEGNRLVNDIKTGKVLDDPRLLVRFLTLSFADLKVHKYYYWFAFPAPLNPTMHIPKGFKPEKISSIEKLHSSLNKIYTEIENESAKVFFIVKLDDNDGLIYKSIKEIMFYLNETDIQQENLENLYFCFADPSEYEQPSWILRIFLSFLLETCQKLHGKSIKVIGIRQSTPSDIKDSLIWDVILPEKQATTKLSQKFIGWEININNKMAPKIISMVNSMDPVRLSDNSINLNLKLMKWRLLPELNLDIIFNTKCMLFGAGTLGCAVARNLLAWGFKTITFLDSGKISFSNPVRQSLYRHEDAIGGTKMKATIAAKRILEINPSAKSEGIVMQIPMPGHSIGDSMKEEILNNLNVIEENIKKHDVLILLTDSRESRWLPTLLGAFHNKIVINAALGFDSFLVMRHGSRKQSVVELSEGEKNIDGLHCISGSELGCYFCNDVTAPGDSLKNRTLDQQCTVTRPGVSNIAASYAVELLVSLLQHKNQDQAPAYYSSASIHKNNSESSIPEGLLGVIPHSIRGQLSTFENILPATSRFSQCIACSESVLGEYESRGKEFLFDVFNSTKYLEDLTGISELGAYENEIIECGESDMDWSE